MEKREEGKTRSSLGFLPFFPTFPFSLRQSQDKSSVLHFLVQLYLLSSRKFPVESSPVICAIRVIGVIRGCGVFP
jgi:hypothetical protein